MLTGAHKTQRMASALTFLEQCHEDGDEFLSHILRLTGDKTRVLFLNVETQEQSKRWMYIHSSNKPACQKVDGNCFLGQERSADDGIHGTRGHNNVRGISRITKKKCIGPFGTNGVECSSMTIRVPIQLLALEHC
jgi:hypothetical protein